MKDAAGDIPGWANSLVMAYVKTCDDPLIQYAVKDSSISWLVDRIEETDTATFMIFHLGHHMEDEDHSNPRFATDGWLYIDTLSKKVYQYDLPNDSLIRWYGKP